MSLFTATNQACPNCDAENTFDAFHSVNADRRPDLRQDIISEEFMTVTCESCDASFRLEPDLNYLDLARETWILAKPIFALPAWGAEEEAAQSSFQDAFGDGAPASAREIGNTLAPRLTFGWPAFREKLIVQQNGIDDVALEKTKLAILRLKEGTELKPGVELRLIDVHTDTLRFAWLEAAGGEELEVFDAPRGLYDAVSEDEQWNEIAGRISAGLFVDCQRLFIDPVPSDDAKP